MEVNQADDNPRAIGSVTILLRAELTSHFGETSFGALRPPSSIHLGKVLARRV